MVDSDKKSRSPPLTHSPLPRSEPNQPNHVAFEFSAIANAETDLPANNKNDRRLHAQFIREKRLADENMVLDEGVQLSIQSVDSKVRSLAEDQMVSDDGSHALNHMVSDEGSGAAPFL